MSGIKEALFQMMEEDHEVAKRRKEMFGEPTEEEMKLGVYDHAASDAASYNDVEVSDEE